MVSCLHGHARVSVLWQSFFSSLQLSLQLFTQNYFFGICFLSIVYCRITAGDVYVRESCDISICTLLYLKQFSKRTAESGRLESITKEINTGINEDKHEMELSEPVECGTATSFTECDHINHDV
jgi:hypothetical protein